jgi:hypothetical protein
MYPRMKVRRVRVTLLWTLLLIVPAAEVTLRIMGVSNPLFTEPDELLGAWHIPHCAGWYVREGKSYVTMNSHGMRDVERHLAKAPGTVRIAVLGDSYTEALQVPSDKTFCSWIERELSNSSGAARKKVEVLNFGCSGFGTTQEYLLLKHRVWEFEPDIILLALTPGTNVRNNCRSLRWDNRPFFVWEQEHLVLDTSFRNGRTFSIPRRQWRGLASCINHSRFLQMLSEIRSSLKEQSLQASKDPAEADESPAMEAGLEIFQEPRDPRWAEAWRITEKVLTLLRDEAARHHTPFRVVLVNSSHQVHPDAAVRHELARKLRVNDLDYAERRLGEDLKREGIPMLALAPVFCKYAEREQVYLHGFRSNGTLGQGHWNEDGHRLAGKVIADWLREQDLSHPVETPKVHAKERSARLGLLAPQLR